MNWLYKSGSIFIEIIKELDNSYTIVRHVSGLVFPEYDYTKRQIKKYTKTLEVLSDKEEAKFLLQK